MTTYDTIFLGSSPNALTAAAYLARSGQKVLVLEQSDHLGGPYTTLEFAPGFHGDSGLISGRLDAKIVSDLKLQQYGLEVIERNSITSLLPDKQSLTLTTDRKKSAEAIRAFSSKDADLYGKFLQLTDMATDLLKNSYKERPFARPASPSDAKLRSSLIDQLKGYGKREMTEVIRVLVVSVRDLLDEWFESTELKGLLATPATRGLVHGPFAAATTFNFLHHLTIGDGYFRATAKGGVGAITRALAEAAKANGAEIRTGAKALRVIVNDGIATGVSISGEAIESQRVVSDCDARYTFRSLVAPPDLEPEFNRTVSHLRYNGCVARVNIALKELPEFVGISKEALGGTLVLAPSLAYLERASDSAKYGEISKDPYLEVTIPTVSDSSLAPSGQHVMSVWFQYASYKGHVDAKQVFETTVEKLSQFAPNLRSLISHHEVITPDDFEKRFNLTEGHLYGGEMAIDQCFYLRPIPGYGQYNSPIENLHLCGAATHPGGGISGIAGSNFVNELGVRDLALSAKE